MKYREPAVAGSFYSKSKEALQSELTDLMPVAANSGLDIKALIVPHAGYFYSGAIAADAFSYVSELKIKPKKVILLGPNHRVGLSGCAIPSYDDFITPLGKVPVDRKLCSKLIEKELVIENDNVHTWEHSLEVQLPFLQHCLADFDILPILVGQIEAQNLVDILSFLLEQDDFLIIVSSDLSHFHPQDKAVQVDENTIDKIINMDCNLEPNQACGCYALNGFLSLAQAKKWHIKLVNKANSGKVNKIKNEVVGYASFVLF